mgnify:CR=1 FL=1
MGGGTATNNVLFSGASSLFGLNSLSDIQTLSGVDALAGTAAADNLLVLSLDSRKLIEIDRTSGSILSQFDLSGVTTQAIEGVTIDERGTIYLVAEQIQDGTATSANPASQLIVLSSTSAVPEPETCALALMGLGIVGGAARRQARRRG